MGEGARQGKLGFEKRRPAEGAAIKRDWNASNRVCALIIHENAKQFGGDGALPVIWARMVLGVAS